MARLWQGGPAMGLFATFAGAPARAEMPGDFGGLRMRLLAGGSARTWTSDGSLRHRSVHADGPASGGTTLVRALNRPATTWTLLSGVAFGYVSWYTHTIAARGVTATDSHALVRGVMTQARVPLGKDSGGRTHRMRSAGAPHAARMRDAQLRDKRSGGAYGDHEGPLRKAVQRGCDVRVEGVHCRGSCATIGMAFAADDMGGGVPRVALVHMAASKHRATVALSAGHPVFAGADATGERMERFLEQCSGEVSADEGGEEGEEEGEEEAAEVVAEEAADAVKVEKAVAVEDAVMADISEDADAAVRAEEVLPVKAAQASTVPHTSHSLLVLLLLTSYSLLLSSYFILHGPGGCQS